MPIVDEELDPQEAVKLLRILVKNEVVTESEFQDKHHLRGSTTAFIRYCSTIKSFVRDGENHRLHNWLRSKRMGQ
jgi:hypothetical protein